MTKRKYKEGDFISDLKFLGYEANRIVGGQYKSVGKFVCNCGKEFIANMDKVVCRVTKSCGCLKNQDKKEIFIDGQLINGLIFLKETKRTTPDKRRGTFLCFCSKEFDAAIIDVKNGHTKSCGCLKSKLTIDRNTTHGKSKSLAYYSYNSMLQRCYNKNNNRYQYYGGRGIIVCDRWLGGNGFKNFLLDMGERPSVGHSIDRIEVDKIYEPSNCKWSTIKEQNNNRSTTIHLEIDGVKKSFLEWVNHFGLNGKEATLRCRLYYGWAPKRVFSQKIREFINPISK